MEAIGQYFIFMLRHFTEYKTINLVLLVEKSGGSCKVTRNNCLLATNVFYKIREGIPLTNIKT